MGFVEETNGGKGRIAVDINQRHNRRTIRLRGYDYSSPGWYFVTVCTQGKEWILGKVVDNQMILSEMGKIVEIKLQETIEIRTNIKFDCYQIMPNHVHVLVIICDFKVGAYCGDVVGAYCGDVVGAYCNTPLQTNGFRSPSNNLGSTIRGLKGAVSRQIGQRIWQRNYYEHIIRNEVELNKIREYISNNPRNWQKDEYY